MMPTGHDTVQRYLGDLIAVVRHVSEAVERHSRDDALNRVVGGAAVVTNASDVLKRQLSALEYHATTIGGVGMAGVIKEAVTSLSGFLTGLYGSIRGEAASRMLRDDYTGLSFVSMCTAMLHTTALAVGDDRTADLTRQHLDELPPVILAISELVPHAVVADLAADRVPIVDPDAPTLAIKHLIDSWRTQPSTDDA